MVLNILKNNVLTCRIKYHYPVSFIITLKKLYVAILDIRDLSINHLRNSASRNGRLIISFIAMIK